MAAWAPLAVCASEIVGRQCCGCGGSVVEAAGTAPAATRAGLFGGSGIVTNANQCGYLDLERVMIVLWAAARLRAHARPDRRNVDLDIH